MEKRPLLIVMVGIPGSGKSTIAEELKNTYNFQIFSSDRIRAEVLGDENNQTRNYYVFKLLYERLKNTLKEGKNCIIDSANVTIKDRSNIFKKLSGVDFDAVAYVVPTDVEECIQRDLKRERKVLREVIEKFARKFTLPSEEEGFSDVIIGSSQSEINRLAKIIDDKDFQISITDEAFER